MIYTLFYTFAPYLISTATNPNIVRYSVFHLLKFRYNVCTVLNLYSIFRYQPIVAVCVSDYSMTEFCTLIHHVCNRFVVVNPRQVSLHRFLVTIYCT